MQSAFQSMPIFDVSDWGTVDCMTGVKHATIGYLSKFLIPRTYIPTVYALDLDLPRLLKTIFFPFFTIQWRKFPLHAQKTGFTIYRAF